MSLSSRFEAAVARSSQVKPLTVVPGYEHVDFLGQGTYGQVVRATTTTEANADVRKHHTVVAVKVLRNGGREEDAKNESRILRMCQHPGIVELLDVSTTPDGKRTTALVFELHECSLSKFVGACVSKPNVWTSATAQLLDALAFLHDTLRVMHCDIKPDNILVQTLGDNKFASRWGEKWIPNRLPGAHRGHRVTLCDFGLAWQPTAPTRHKRKRAGGHDNDEERGGEDFGRTVFHGTPHVVSAWWRSGKLMAARGKSSVLAYVSPGRVWMKIGRFRAADMPKLARDHAFLPEKDEEQFQKAFRHAYRIPVTAYPRHEAYPPLMCYHLRDEDLRGMRPVYTDHVLRLWTNEDRTEADCFVPVDGQWENEAMCEFRIDWAETVPYTPHIDVFALGACFLRMSCGRDLFNQCANEWEQRLLYRRLFGSTLPGAGDNSRLVVQEPPGVPPLTDADVDNILLQPTKGFGMRYSTSAADVRRFFHPASTSVVPDLRARAALVRGMLQDELTARGALDLFLSLYFPAPPQSCLPPCSHAAAVRKIATPSTAGTAPPPPPVPSLLCDESPLSLSSDASSPSPISSLPDSPPAIASPPRAPPPPPLHTSSVLCLGAETPTDVGGCLERGAPVHVARGMHVHEAVQEAPPRLAFFAIDRNRLWPPPLTQAAWTAFKKRKQSAVFVSGLAIVTCCTVYLYVINKSPEDGVPPLQRQTIVRSSWDKMRSEVPATAEAFRAMYTDWIAPHATQQERCDIEHLLLP